MKLTLKHDLFLQPYRIVSEVLQGYPQRTKPGTFLIIRFNEKKIILKCHSNVDMLICEGEGGESNMYF